MTRALISHVALAPTSPLLNLRRAPSSSTVTIPPHSVEGDRIITPSGMGRVKSISLMGPGLAELSIVMVSSLLLPIPISSGERLISTSGGCATPAKEMLVVRRIPERRARKPGRVSLQGGTGCEFIAGRQALVCKGKTACFGRVSSTREIPH